MCECAASSVGRAWDTWCRGRAFESHVGQTSYFFCPFYTAKIPCHPLTNKNVKLPAMRYERVDSTVDKYPCLSCRRPGFDSRSTHSSLSHHLLRYDENGKYFFKRKIFWKHRVSTSEPLACKASTLPIELYPHSLFSRLFNRLLICFTIVKLTHANYFWTSRTQLPLGNWVPFPNNSQTIAIV